MIAEMMRLCDDWDAAVERKDISVHDMLLNEKMAFNSLGRLKKFIREMQGKLDDAKMGVYRYRILEWELRNKNKKDNADKLNKLDADKKESDEIETPGGSLRISKEKSKEPADDNDK